MPAPAVTITTTTSPPPRSLPTDTGITYLAGIFATGPTGTLVTEDDAIASLNQWIARYGGGTATNARLSYAVEYDWVETYFRNGGNKLYCSRVVGTTPVYATLNLAGTSGTTLVATATEYGAFYNTTYKIQVTNGSDGSHRYVKLCAGASHPSATDTVLATSADAATRDAAVGVLTDPVLGFSVAITAGAGSGLPTVAASTVLASGADDHATATSTQVTTALNQFQPDLGPGQVVAPNFGGTSAVQLVLLAHAAANGRYAVCDTTDIAPSGKSTLTALAATLQGTANGSYGKLYTPWITVAPYAVDGTDRRVPASALVCARDADTDALFHPNRAAAGSKDSVGIARWATGVGATFSRTPLGASDADDLDAAGVNLIIQRRGQVIVFGVKSLVTPGGAENDFLQAPNGRYRMWLVARATGIGEGEQFDNITPTSIAEFHIGLEGLLVDDYARRIIVGDPEDDRFSTAANVDTSVSDHGPNTPETIDAGQMNAAVAVRPAKTAEFINITITFVSQTAAIA